MTLEQLVKKYRPHEVDFILPKVTGDNRAYLDLYLVYKSPDKRWHKVHSLIYEYLNYYLEAYRKGEISEDDLIPKLHFPEVPYIALGHCKDGIYGRGSGDNRAWVFKDSIFDNEEVQKVGMPALAKMSIAIGGLGPDLLSDLVANFAMHYLLEYTLEQAAIYDLPLAEFALPRALDAENFEWEPVAKARLPYFKQTGEPRILVPKHLTRRLPLLTTGSFFDNYLQHVLQEEKMDRLRAHRTFGHEPKVSLTEIIEELKKKYETTGEAAREISLKRPDLVETYLKNPLRYKKTRRRKENIDWNQYTKDLARIPSGKDHAREYAEYIRKVFTSLYDGSFINGSLEENSVDGLYYYDITFANSANTNFFNFLRNQKIKTGVVIFEAKNYGKKHIGNNAFNQASGYTIAGARELVFLVSREAVNKKDIERAKRHLLSHKVIILPLADGDIQDLLRQRENNPLNFDTLLIERAKQILSA